MRVKLDLSLHDLNCVQALGLRTLVGHLSCSTCYTQEIWLNMGVEEVNADEGTDSSSPTAEEMNEVDSDSWTVDKKLRNMLTNILVDNGKLRKQVNSVIRYALKKKISSPGESESPSSEMYKTSI
ncbi:hypothetical protein KY290_026133 [Solanum tuberosum]|uniref:Uncharacterized protein n=1 Tax=Solanum tuberosum TaxID=4113 RepID=A0ABQ7UWL8_SOLTU|nr:hypothetical protein KY284_024986 [Solanum tuberosum]KAH0677210.1 hypothetical protein KY285_025011 [Solanum tuberosum]KAH0755863.1 hypothetical protein KY290_026133 [Solanum tuberosum]